MKKRAFAEDEKKRIERELWTDIDPRCVGTRRGAGNAQVYYVEGWRVIDSANRIFRFDGWSSEIYGMQRLYRKKQPDGRIQVGYSCLCRIRLRDGTSRVDTGFGCAENARTHALAEFKAQKEAATDALKRAFRQFGRAFGNCCYDKEYQQRVRCPASRAGPPAAARPRAARAAEGDISLDEEDLVFNEDTD